MTLLSVRNLAVDFATEAGTVNAVRGVSFDLDRGETLAIVGESGCGKSVTVNAVMGLQHQPERLTGSVKLNGQELTELNDKQRRQIVGRQIGMVFQNPLTSLNPTMKVGDQIAEPLRVHWGMSPKEAQAEAVRLLDRTGITAAKMRVNQYPFEFSGGMLQRAVIAMALACKPGLLIADEPTTALDATIQHQILELLRRLQEEEGMALLLITHDLGVVAQMANRVAVMYAGKMVETGDAVSVFHQAAHPYMQGLKQAMPSLGQARNEPLIAIEGSPPDLLHPLQGCNFAPRCPKAMQVCARVEPPVFPVAVGHGACCWLHHPDVGGVADD